MKPATRAGAAGDQAKAHDTANNTAGVRRWQVEIVNPQTGRPKLWNSYDTREAAEQEAAKLRAVKMFAQIRRQDDEPEYRKDRRRFLIAMFMLGAIPPRRVVERIVAEVEREGRHDR